MYGGREPIAYTAASFTPPASFVKESPTAEMDVEEIQIITPEESANVTAAFFTLIGVNSIPVSSDDDRNIRAFLKHAPREAVVKNFELLAKYGIIPPIAKSTGGGPRDRTPTKKAKEAAEALAAQAEASAKRGELVARKAVKKREKQEFQAERASRIATISDIQARFNDMTWRDLAPAEQSLAQCEMHQPSIFARALFSQPAITVWQNTVTTRLRYIWELHSEDAQCNAILQSNGVGQECYICGLLIQPKTGNRNPLGPSCEHILPVMQAIFFLDLYRETDPLTEERRAFLQMEYAWSHLCCNEVKNVTSLLKTVVDSEAYPTWEFDEANTRYILSTIFKEGRHGSEVLIPLLPPGTNIDEFINQRVASIKTSKMDRIVDYIRSKGINGVAAIIGLQNCVNFGKIDKRFTDILASERTGTLAVTNPRRGPKATAKARGKRKGGNKVTQRRKNDHL